MVAGYNQLEDTVEDTVEDAAKILACAVWRPAAGSTATGDESLDCGHVGIHDCHLLRQRLDAFQRLGA